jgi:hypothetical protein
MYFLKKIKQERVHKPLKEMDVLEIISLLCKEYDREVIDEQRCYKVLTTLIVKLFNDGFSYESFGRYGLHYKNVGLFDVEILRTEYDNWVYSDKTIYPCMFEINHVYNGLLYKVYPTDTNENNLIVNITDKNMSLYQENNILDGINAWFGLYDLVFEISNANGTICKSFKKEEMLKNLVKYLKRLL